MICLNKNNPDIKNILDNTGVHILTLTIAYNKWIKDNPSEDRMPTIEELGLLKKPLSLKESKLNDVMTYLLDVFDISLSGDNYIYDNNVYSKESIVKKLLSLEFSDDGSFIFNADSFVNNNPSVVSYVNTRLDVPLSIKSLKKNLNVYVSQSTDPVYALSNFTEFVDFVNNKNKPTETIDSSYIEVEERISGLRNKDKSRKRYTSETKATTIARNYNKNNPDSDLKATVIKIMGEIGDTRVYYAVQLVERDVLPSASSKIEIEKVAELIKSDESIMKQLGITYTNEDGNLCAANGLSNAVSGTQWKIVKDFKGKPKHRQGGYDITIKDNGFYIGNLKAKNGLVLPAIKAKDRLVVKGGDDDNDLKTMKDSYQYTKDYYNSRKFEERYKKAYYQSYGSFDGIRGTNEEVHFKDLIKREDDMINKYFTKDLNTIRKNLDTGKHYLLQGNRSQSLYDQLVRKYKNRPTPTEEGVGSHFETDTNTSFVYNKQTDKTGKQVPVSAIAPHEFSHQAVNKVVTIPLKQQEEIKSMQDKNVESHLEGLYETKADIDAFRYSLYKNNIYNAMEEDFTKEHLEEYKKRNTDDFFYTRLKELYGEENIIKLMNMVADNSKNNNLNLA